MTVPESSFTRPHAECGHPEWWSAEDEQAAENEVVELVAGLVRAVQPEYVVETGTHVGRMAFGIGQALARNGHGRLDTIEVDAGCVSAAADRCAGLPVTVVHGSSLEFDPAERIGFAWFDSLLGLRVAEFRRFLPWLEPGAVVGFHDTGPQFGDGLRSGIESLAGQRLIRPIALRTPRGCVLAQVIGR